MPHSWILLLVILSCAHTSPVKRVSNALIENKVTAVGAFTEVCAQVKVPLPSAPGVSVRLALSAGVTLTASASLADGGEKNTFEIYGQLGAAVIVEAAAVLSASLFVSAKGRLRFEVTSKHVQDGAEQHANGAFNALKSWAVDYFRTANLKRKLEKKMDHFELLLERAQAQAQEQDQSAYRKLLVQEVQKKLRLFVKSVSDVFTSTPEQLRPGCISPGSQSWTYSSHSWTQSCPETRNSESWTEFIIRKFMLIYLNLDADAGATLSECSKSDGTGHLWCDLVKSGLLLEKDNCRSMLGVVVFHKEQCQKENLAATVKQLFPQLFPDREDLFPSGAVPNKLRDELDEDSFENPLFEGVIPKRDTSYDDWDEFMGVVRKLLDPATIKTFPTNPDAFANFFSDWPISEVDDVFLYGKKGLENINRALESLKDSSVSLISGSWELTIGATFGTDNADFCTPDTNVFQVKYVRTYEKNFQAGEELHLTGEDVTLTGVVSIPAPTQDKYFLLFDFIFNRISKTRRLSVKLDIKSLFGPSQLKEEALIRTWKEPVLALGAMIKEVMASAKKEQTKSGFKAKFRKLSKDMLAMLLVASGVASVQTGADSDTPGKMDLVFSREAHFFLELIFERVDPTPEELVKSPETDAILLIKAKCLSLSSLSIATPNLGGVAPEGQFYLTSGMSSDLFDARV